MEFLVVHKSLKVFRYPAAADFVLNPSSKLVLSKLLYSSQIEHLTVGAFDNDAKQLNVHKRGWFYPKTRDLIPATALFFPVVGEDKAICAHKESLFPIPQQMK